MTGRRELLDEDIRHLVTARRTHRKRPRGRARLPGGLRLDRTARDNDTIRQFSSARACSGRTSSSLEGCGDSQLYAGGGRPSCRLGRAGGVGVPRPCRKRDGPHHDDQPRRARRRGAALE